ncbi:Permease of the drug/metabolite transporter (DMT) superfamily [Grimontia indica]|uniref:Permease of the drug/metabolite transporter (DMT) superfamily n=2 Tax=Grimontia indica TaxID=1056512 RepID=R1IRG6_9GAMM|nr:Permease of the drug/metabolite transporter (DMT) superfamily [Grimontia indica]
MMASSAKNRTTQGKTAGYLSMMATLLVWAGFFLSLKGGANSDLLPADLALMRFLVPALLLTPFVYQARKQIVAIPAKYMLGMFVGSGLPYLLVASNAMQYVPVSHGSALVPGTLPLFVTAIAVLFYQQPLSSHRKLGLAAIAIGTALFLVSNISSSQGIYDWAQSKGHLLFLLGSLVWAIFTISARVANLNALACSGVLAIMSCLVLFVAITVGWLPSTLHQTSVSQWPWQQVFTHTLLQGVGAGIVSSCTYLYAVKQLGAERSAAFGSATPVIATLLAIPIFNEVPDAMTMSALGFVCVGSLVASNIFMKNDTSLNYQPPMYQK